MRRSVIAPLVLILAACGGGGGGSSSGSSGDFCSSANSFAEMGAMIAGSGTPEDMAGLTPALEELKKTAPKEIRSDVGDVVDAYKEILDLIGNGQSPESDEAMGKLMSIALEVAKPAERMTNFIKDTCGLDIEATAATAPTNVDGGSSDFEPGPISYEVVNLDPQNAPVDVYVTTTDGMVKEFEIEKGLAAGETVTVNPPSPGYLLVVPAGTKTIDSFSDANIASYYVDENDGHGARRLVVVHPDFSSFAKVEGASTSDEFWLDSTADVSFNEMPASIPGKFVLAIANITKDSFYVAAPGAGQCLEPAVSGFEDVGIGGTSRIPYAFEPGAYDVAIHSWDAGDYDCTLDPVGSFSGKGTDGGRALAIIYSDADGKPAVWTLDI